MFLSQSFVAHLQELEKAGPQWVLEPMLLKDILMHLTVHIFYPLSLPSTNPTKANFSTAELKPTFLCLHKDILLLLQNHPSYLSYMMILNSCHMHHHSHTPPSHSHSAPFFYSYKIKSNGLINGYRIG